MTVQPIDLCHVPNVARMLVSDAVTLWAADPTNADTQLAFVDPEDPSETRVSETLDSAVVEVEVDYQPYEIDETGLPGENLFLADSYILIHVAIPMRWHMDEARKIMSWIIGEVLGRSCSDVFFYSALPEDFSPNGRAMQRGMTYAINYRLDSIG